MDQVFRCFEKQRKKNQHNEWTHQTKKCGYLKEKRKKFTQPSNKSDSMINGRSEKLGKLGQLFSGADFVLTAAKFTVKPAG